MRSSCALARLRLFSSSPAQLRKAVAMPRRDLRVQGIECQDRIGHDGIAFAVLRMEGEGIAHGEGADRGS